MEMKVGMMGMEMMTVIMERMEGAEWRVTG